MTLHRTVVISRNPQVQHLVRRFTAQLFVADDLNEAFDVVTTIDPELAVFDNSFSPESIRAFVTWTDKNSPGIPVIVVAADPNSTTPADSFLKAGASDFLHLQSGSENFAAALEKIKTTSPPAAQTNDFFAESCAAAVSLAGKSKAICESIRMVKLLAASRCNPILITGETGTGKELAARAIHYLRCPAQRFVAVNCAAMTSTLLESELFGHVKGAFTGADKDKTGLLELAGEGTILLDEISEMPVELQAKLLRVLQERTFRNVGGTDDITCNATIITSSNRDLAKEIKAGRFRADILYRLNVCPVTLDPLRAPARRTDIPLLANYFLKTSQICPEKYGKILAFTSLALEVLEKYHWPGNVRELKNVIERAILLETTDKIGLNSIIINPLLSNLAADQSDCTFDAIRDFSLAKAERELISRALQQTGWQKTRAATLLGITRATLYAKVKQYNIERGSYLPKHTDPQQACFEPIPVP